MRRTSGSSSMSSHQYQGSHHLAWRHTHTTFQYLSNHFGISLLYAYYKELKDLYDRSSWRPLAVSQLCDLGTGTTGIVIVSDNNHQHQNNYYDVEKKMCSCAGYDDYQQLLEDPILSHHFQLEAHTGTVTITYFRH